MRKINPPAPKFRRLIFTGFLFFIGTGLFSQTIRQNETASFNEIKTGLDQRKIEYTERDLLADYGVFGKSIFTGNAASETNPFLFVFPVSDCYQDLAFSLAEHTATEATNTPVIFLADAWSSASLLDLLETLDNPQNAVLMYFTQDMSEKNSPIESTSTENISPENTSTENTPTENTATEPISIENKTSSFIVTFFQGTIKNPFHLTGTFAKYLEDRNIPFSFRDKNIILTANTFSDMNEAVSVLLPFAAASPPPETDPDIYYIAADFSSRKIILDNVAILKIVLIASAALLFINLFFAVIFNKKRILVIMLSVFFIFAGIFLLNNPLYSPKDTAHDIALNPAEPQNIRNTERTSGVKVTRTVFLDRITYTIKAAYDIAPTHIAIFYDMENAAMPAEVYESPFPSEITESRITFTLGEYPPNPFETEIAFPRAYPGILTVIATSEQGAAVWTEQEP
jgi:hypothetical protein